MDWVLSLLEGKGRKALGIQPFLSQSYSDFVRVKQKLLLLKTVRILISAYF